MTMEDLPLRRPLGRPPKLTDVLHETSTPELVAQKVGLADLTTPAVGGWLIHRLHERYPHLSDASLLGMMRSWLFANDMSFMSASGGEESAAIGLASIVHEPLSARPTIREIFVVTRERGQGTGSERCAAAIYRHWKRWGKGLGAAELRVGAGSDVTLGRLKELLSGEARSQVFIDLLR